MSESESRPADWLPFLEAIADRADRIALHLFRDASLRVESKGDESPVTEADRRIEAVARGLVRERHPDLGVYGEEEGETGSADVRLIIDPIDSTRNFVRGIPAFATLLAVERDGEIVAGLVSAPALGSRWLDGRRLRVSATGELSGAHLFHGDLLGALEPWPPGRLEPLRGRIARGRGFGDFWQHVLVAQGAGEAAIDPEVSPWDVAPLQVIVEEAGGRATDFAGRRTIYGGSLLSTNGLLHEVVLQRLKGSD